MVNKKYLKKEKRRSDPWDFFVIGISQLLKGGGSVIFFTEGEVLNLPPSTPPPHTQKASRKILNPSDKIFYNSSPHPLPPPYTRATLIYDNPILLSGPAEYWCSFDKPKHKLYINIFYYYLALRFKWLQKLLGYNIV